MEKGIIIAIVVLSIILIIYMLNNKFGVKKEDTIVVESFTSPYTLDSLVETEPVVSTRPLEITN